MQLVVIKGMPITYKEFSDQLANTKDFAIWAEWLALSAATVLIVSVFLPYFKSMIKKNKMLDYKTVKGGFLLIIGLLWAASGITGIVAANGIKDY